MGRRENWLPLRPAGSDLQTEGSQVRHLASPPSCLSVAEWAGCVVDKAGKRELYVPQWQAANSPTSHSPSVRVTSIQFRCEHTHWLKPSLYPTGSHADRTAAPRCARAASGVLSRRAATDSCCRRPRLSSSAGLSGSDVMEELELFRKDTGDKGMDRGASREAQDRGSWLDSD